MGLIEDKVQKTTQNVGEGTFGPQPTMHRRNNAVQDMMPITWDNRKDKSLILFA